MMIKKTLFLALVLMILVGCDQAKKIRSSVRKILVGDVTKDLQAPTEKNQVSPEDSAFDPKIFDSIPKEGSKNIYAITPKKKILNLLNAYTQNPEKSMKILAINEFKKNANLFNSQSETELISAIDHFLPLIEAHNWDALEVLAQIFFSLNGEIRNQVALTLNQAIEVDIGKFFEVYFNPSINTKIDEHCFIATFSPPAIEEEQKFNFLDQRKNALKTYLLSRPNTADNIRWSELANLCIKAVDTELFRLRHGKMITPIPAATENIEENPSPPQSPVSN